MAEDIRSVGRAEGCSDLCADGRKLMGLGKTRLQVMVNDYCPFYGIREQFEQFIFNSETVKNLGAAHRNAFLGFGPEVPGIGIKDRPTLRDNLLFRPQPNATDKKTGKSVAVKDKLVDPTCRDVVNKWNVSANKASDCAWNYLPHYSFALQPSLFGSKGYGINDVRDTPPATETNDQKATRMIAENRASVWRQTPVAVTDANRAIPVVDSKGKTVTSIVQSGSAVFMEQVGGGKQGDGPGVHWTLQKRRPVFQGADFVVEVHRKALDGYRISDGFKNKLDTVHSPIDVNLYADNLDVGTYPRNAAVIGLTDDNLVDPKTKARFDLANQQYLIIEIGINDPNHHYYLLLTERAEPTLIHVGSFPVLGRVREGKILNSKVITPTGAQAVSRILSRCEGLSGAELLNQEKLVIKVKNHLGKMVVTFSGYESIPWVISRADYVPDVPVDSQGNPLGSRNPIDVGYREQTVPIVIPADYLRIHGGGYRMSINWGYLTYEAIAWSQLPQQIHIEGSQHTTPQMSDVSLMLSAISSEHRVMPPTNDAAFNHDALVFKETVTGKEKSWKATEEQPAAFKSYGRGYVPDPRSATTTVKGYEWLKQDLATPENFAATVGISTIGDLATVGNDGRAKGAKVGLVLRSGAFVFGPDEEYGDSCSSGGASPDKCVLYNVLGAISTGFSLNVAPRGQLWRTNPVDISPFVTGFSETWSAQDYTKIEHTGQLRLLISEGMSPTSVPTMTGSNTPGRARPKEVTTANLSEYIAGLANKTFYVRIKAWREQTELFDNKGPDSGSYIFTGLCQGGKISYSTNQRIMECQVHDLSKTMEDRFFTNAPFFAAVRDVVAMYEIFKMAGFLDRAATGVITAPASILKKAVDLSRTEVTFRLPYQDGYRDGNYMSYAWITPFALPGSYDELSLDQPFKFKDGDKFFDCISRIATPASKTYYFDRFGVFHYEDRLDNLLLASRLNEADVIQMAKEHFEVTPQRIDNCSEYYRLAFNANFTWERLAGDTVNQITLISADANGGVLIGGDIKFDLIDDPNAEGFIGYQKQFLQMSGVFGSADAVKAAVENYTAMYKPPLRVSFETLGRTYLKALDIITFRGLDSVSGAKVQPLRITNISTEIDAEKNTWWSKIDAEWIFPGDGVDWSNSGG